MEQTIQSKQSINPEALTEAQMQKLVEKVMKLWLADQRLFGSRIGGRRGGR